MLDPQHAAQLHQAGLAWQPAKRDNFMIPNGDLSDDVFTLNDQTILIHTVNGEYAVTFHGSVEWALDHVMLTDVLWLPNETQLREAIQLRLGGNDAHVQLDWQIAGYRCTINHLGQQHSFEAAAADEAYADALLFLLKSETVSSEMN